MQLLQLFEWMQQNGKINASSFSSYMKFMGKNLNPVKAMEIFNGIKDESAKKNIFICNSVLSCLVRNGKFDSSIKLFHQMKQDGLMPDAVTYSTVGYSNSYYVIPIFLLAFVFTCCSSNLELQPVSCMMIICYYMGL